MITGDLLSACPHRQFHTLPDLLDSWAALPNSCPSALRAMQGGSLYHFYDGLWYDPAGRRTHDTTSMLNVDGYGISDKATLTMLHYAIASSRMSMAVGIGAVDIDPSFSGSSSENVHIFRKKGHHYFLINFCYHSPFSTKNWKVKKFKLLEAAPINLKSCIRAWERMCARKHS